MAHKPLVGYDHPEDIADSDTEPDKHLDIDDEDDFLLNDKSTRSTEDEHSLHSRGSATNLLHNIGELIPKGSLVSYVGEEETDEEEEASDSLPRVPFLPGNDVNSQNDGISSIGSLSPKSIDSPVSEANEPKKEMSQYAIQLPPEPPGRCSRMLQEKIARLMEKKERDRLSLNDHVQKNKDFRNPSIYEKLVLFCSINETGTNYPKKYFDPTGWGPESHYDALAKVQKEAHDKKEREKKNRTQVDFVTATKKSNLPVTAPIGAVSVDDKLKKSKWDKPIETTKVSVVPAIIPKPNTVTDVPAKKPKLAS